MGDRQGTGIVDKVGQGSILKFISVKMAWGYTVGTNGVTGAALQVDDLAGLAVGCREDLVVAGYAPFGANAPDADGIGCGLKCGHSCLSILGNELQQNENRDHARSHGVPWVKMAEGRLQHNNQDQPLVTICHFVTDLGSFCRF